LICLFSTFAAVAIYGWVVAVLPGIGSSAS
jgi:hypothetical protein